jgi:hypothetical protein
MNVVRGETMIVEDEYSGKISLSQACERRLELFRFIPALSNSGGEKLPKSLAIHHHPVGSYAASRVNCWHGFGSPAFFCADSSRSRLGPRWRAHRTVAALILAESS